jgi:hypothetical protein
VDSRITNQGTNHEAGMRWRLTAGRVTGDILSCTAMVIYMVSDAYDRWTKIRFRDEAT